MPYYGIVAVIQFLQHLDHRKLMLEGRFSQRLILCPERQPDGQVHPPSVTSTVN
jgi:hypothetical protein